MVLDLETFDASGLTLLEVLDMADATGEDAAALTRILGRPGMDGTKARVVYALAWVIVRRAEPGVRFSEVITWKLELRGKLETKVSNRAEVRARARVNAAKLAGVTPKEAEQLTVAELAVYRDQQPRRAVRKGRRR